MTNGKTVLDIPLIQQVTLTIRQYMMSMKIYLQQRLPLSFIHLVIHITRFIKHLKLSFTVLKLKILCWIRQNGSNASYLQLLLFDCSVVSDSLQRHGLQHSRLSGPSPSPRACSNSCPLNQWCHPTISSSVVPFSSCFQSFPASGSFPISSLFSSGGQSIGASAST